MRLVHTISLALLVCTVACRGDEPKPSAPPSQAASSSGEPTASGSVSSTEPASTEPASTEPSSTRREGAASEPEARDLPPGTQPVPTKPHSKPETPTPGKAGQWHYWTGSVSTPGRPFLFALKLRRGPEGPQGIFHALGKLQAEVEALDLRLGTKGMTFAVVRPGKRATRGEFELKFGPGPDIATGTITQRGRSLPVKMERVTRAAHAEAVRSRRPQHPKPPYPYITEDLVVTNPKDGVKLAGTLCLPRGSGPFPAVLLLTGSGEQDRDETLYGHRPFLVLADHLARNGIASYRMDDRGVGASGGNLSQASYERLAEDARAALELMKSRKEIDAARMGLIGHSEGGMVAPIVATQTSDVSFLVLMAAPGVPGKELALMQQRAMLLASGANEAKTTRFVTAKQRLHDAVLAESPLAEIRERLAHSIELHYPQATKAQRAQYQAAAMVSLRAPITLSMLKSEPSRALRKVRSPVLILAGTLDLHVPAEPNVAALRSALRAGGNEQVQAEIFPKLNHLFQHAKTGLITEMESIEETMAPAVLKAITSWIQKRTGEGK